MIVYAGVCAAEDGDDTSWKFKSKVSLSLAQSSFNTAWAGDEVGTLSWIATWNSSASKVLAPWARWKNSLLTQFGQTHQQDPDREIWLAPSKSSDKITYRGEVLFTFGGFLDPFVSLDADSQFFTELKGVATKPFTPTLFTEAAGIARVFSETERLKLNSRFGFAMKQRVDRLALDSVTMEYGTDTAVEGGFEWFSTARLSGNEERAVYATELRVFKAVETTESDPQKRLYWTAVDVDWQNTLSSKVTKWLAFDLFWQVLYDKQIDRTGQFKQTLGVGVTWQLASS
jgi:hypothetical protein